MKYISKYTFSIVKKIFIYENIFKNFNYGFSTNILNNLFKILQVFLFTNFFTNQDYALWIICFSFISFFSLMDFGLSSYLSNSLIKINYSKNRKKFIEYISLGKSILIYSILFFFTIICIFIFSFNLEKIFDLENSQVSQFIYISIILLIGLSVNSYLGLYFAILRALDKMHIGLKINFLIILTQIIIFIILCFFENLILLSLTLSIPYILGILPYKKVISKELQNEKFIFNLNLKKNYFKELFIGSFSFFIITISHALMNFIPIYFLKKFYDDEFLIYFFVYKSLFMLAVQLLNIIYYSFSPKINQLYFSVKNKDFDRLFKNLFVISIIFTFLFLFFNYFFGNLILSFWTNDKVKFNITIFSIFSVFLVIRVSWTFIINIFQSLNFVNLTSLFYLLYNFCLFIFLYFYLGNYDFVYSLKFIVASELILFLFLFYLIYHYFKAIKLSYFFLLFINFISLFVLSKI
tara:strand:+ start:58 stop:1452 length:1395 start_codon:yes stop_codon:yes gene_type:complete